MTKSEPSKSKSIAFKSAVASTVILLAIFATGTTGQVVHVSTIDLSKTVSRQFRIPFTSVVLAEQIAGTNQSALFQELARRDIAEHPRDNGTKILVADRSAFGRDGESYFFKTILEQESRWMSWLEHDPQTATMHLRHMLQQITLARTSSDLDKCADDVVAARYGSAL